MAPSSSTPISTSTITPTTTAATRITPSVSSTSSPCAACKCLRRKCQPDCVFAPYFPPDQPQKFVHVHRVFGASNVTKILNELHPYQREDAVNSLAYEADMRLRDPVYGCVGVISILQHQLRQLQMDLSCAKAELLKYQSTVSSNGNGIGLLNVNHSNCGSIGIGQDQFFPSTPVRDVIAPQYMMLRTSFDSDSATRWLVNATAYETAGVSSAAATMNANGFGPFCGQFVKSSAAGGDERPGIGPL